MTLIHCNRDGHEIVNRKVTTELPATDVSYHSCYDDDFNNQS